MTMTRSEDELAAARAIRHRLLPGKALRNLKDAGEFLEEMGILLQTPHPYLPSLFGAAQGEPAKPGVEGFGQWPEHAWSWAGELAKRDDVLMTKVLLGQRTLVHERLWKALDAAVRGVKAQSTDEQAIVEALQSHDSMRTDRLPALAGFGSKPSRKHYTKAMSELQWTGVVLCTPALVDNHKHVAIAELWTKKFPQALAKSQGIADFVKACIEAAGTVPRRDVLQWFRWPRPQIDAAIEQLISGEHLHASDGSLLSV
jgi:hypothetical protein